MHALLESTATPFAIADYKPRAGTSPLKLYTLYAPPNHRDGVVHHTRNDAKADSEHFDGKTTELGVDWLTGNLGGGMMIR